jgi:hypothetical protein
MPECQMFPEVLIVRTAEEFAAGLDVTNTRGRDVRFQERLRELARENSWTTRVGLVIRHLGAIRSEIQS